MSVRYLLLNQLQALRYAGYEVSGISSPGPDVPAIEAGGIRHIAVPMTRRAFTPLADLRSLRDLYRVIRQERPTVVHTHTPKAGLLGRCAAKLAGVPIIVHTSHGFLFHEKSPWHWRWVFATLERLAAHCSDLVFSVNREDVGTAIREGICAPSEIRLMGDGGIGVDLSRFDPRQATQEAVTAKRKELGLADNAEVVGFVGRLVREKGLLELFAAARIVREQVPNVQFLLVGPVDTHKRDALTPDAAREYGIADICHFLGIRQDMPELYALMDCFVLPSYREGFPCSPMEASAMGVPCVVTDIRGCREAVEHGRNGLLVPLGDVPALAEAIVELLTDQEKAARMGAEGRRMALERFDERLVFERVKAEYARLLREKGLPVPQPLATEDETP
jgi:glycosyltransferase involved in cell wall biosynthesis